MNTADGAARENSEQSDKCQEQYYHPDALFDLLGDSVNKFLYDIDGEIYNPRQDDESYQKPKNRDCDANHVAAPIHG